MPADALHAEKIGKTLMIVEDEILVAITLRDELESAGFDVLDLTDRHEQAIAVARENTPDLALVNIQLRGRDDGIELAQQLKALGTPVLLISGQVSRARSAQTVAIGSMPKPYSAPAMVEAVKYLLDRLRGEKKLEPPAGLEVFEATTNDFADSVRTNAPTGGIKL